MYVSPNFMDLCCSSTGSNQHKSNAVEDLCHSSTGSLKFIVPRWDFAENYDYKYDIMQ